MRLKDKVRKQRKEIAMLWKHVTFPKPVRKKGDTLFISVALSKEKIESSLDPILIIDNELFSIRKKLLKYLKGETE